MAAACTILLAATLAVLLAAIWYTMRQPPGSAALTEHYAQQDPYKLMSYVRATRTVPMR